MRYRIEFDLPDNETVLERISTVNVQWCVWGYSGTAHVKPAIEPERKKGKWISLDDFRGKYNEFGYKCSECNEQSDYEENFCPNCGADMREVAE